MLVRLLAVSLVFWLGIGCRSGPANSAALSDATREAVRAVDSAYVRGWVANDPTAVMATLTTDAVIIPDGMAPIQGDSAVRAYWWPEDGSETRVIDYETTIQEVGGAGTTAYLRGTGRLSFDWRSDPSEEWQAYSSRSVWLALLARGLDDRWRMTHRMWHQLDQ